ncbi:MAG: YdcF family protein [Bacillota bacterium]
MFLIIAGALMVLDTIAVALVSNYNFGVILPGMLGLPLLITGIYYEPLRTWAQRSRIGAAIKWAMRVGYAAVALSLAITVSLMVAATLDKPQPGADAVIVLGAGIRDDRVPATLAARLERAVEYAEPNPETLFVVTGGKGQGESITEALAMKRYLVSTLGVPENRILMEDQATSTQENFRYCLPILREHLSENARVVFVTSAFHMFRAELVAKKEGVQAEALSCPTTWYLIPNCYLREAAAIAQYYISGKL